MLTKHRPTRWLLALLLLLPCAGTASAETSLSVRSSNRFVTDASYDLLSSDDLLPLMEINAAHQVLTFWPGHLWVEGSYLLGVSDNKIFGGRARAWTSTHTILAGVRLSVPLLGWLEPMVRVSAGVVVGGLGLESEMAHSQDADDWTAAFCGQALAGVEFKIPRISVFKNVTGGVVVEGGYTFATELEFNLETSVDDDLRLIPRSGSTLGSLDLSGPMVVVGALIQF